MRHKLCANLRPWHVDLVSSALTSPPLIWKANTRIESAWPYERVFGEVCGLTPASLRVGCTAERYGGAGLGTNGGGVRCVNYLDTQFKGVGANFLAGTFTDRWHRHGALSTQDGVREVIWGELFEAALPFGAVRSKAIASTGTSYAVEVGKGKQPGLAPRALLARELVVRPAHFMRSIFWEPSEDAKHLPSDTERTRAACLASHEVLRSELSKRPWTKEPVDVDSPTWAECWTEVWRRAAYQLAASRAKRLVHGSMTPSNYGVDGRWLDFSTCTALSDHGRAIVAPGGVDVWRQEGLILEAMEDLGFYLTKYLPSADSRALQVDGWKATFEATLMERTKWEFALRSGVPDTWLRQMDTRVVNRFVDAAVKVGLDGIRNPYLYFGGSEHAMPLRSGRHDLAGALRLLAWGVNSPGASRALIADCVPDAALADELTQAYAALVVGMRKLAGETASTAAVALAANTMRVNLPLDGLWRYQLDVATDRVVRDRTQDIGVYIDSVIHAWCPILQRLELKDVSTNAWLTETDWRLTEDLTLITPQNARATVSDLGEFVDDCGNNADRDQVRRFVNLETGHAN